MSWPHYSSMPSEDELAGTIEKFLGLRPEFDGFIKLGKTSLDKETKQPGNRYGPFDRYEQLSLNPNLRPELFKCPLKLCTFVSTHDDIMLHRKTRFH